MRTTGSVTVIGTEQNNRAVFQKIGTAYVQVWPTDAAVRDVLTAGANGTLIYQESAGDVLRTYRQSDGRLIAYKRLSSGREMQLGYDTAGLPLTLADSAGTWQWNITTNATDRRITSIAVAGRPDINWTFTYNTAGNLATVIAPDANVWRTYIYSGTQLAEVRDSLGNLIESHTYEASGRAISSLGPTAEITNIQYDQPGRVPGEIVTLVTTGTGLVSSYYQRFVGGRVRTVEVEGGCSSCGMDDAVYGYDAEGRLVREQNDRGFLTVRTYDGTSLRSVSGPWQPAGCDPLTDANRCRLSADTIMSTALAATAATTTTTYSYTDAAWPARPTIIAADTVLGGSGNHRTESLTYGVATGEVLQRKITGWTGTSAVPVPEIRTTTQTLYNGTEAAAFDPCTNAIGTCSFSASWTTLP